MTSSPPLPEVELLRLQDALMEVQHTLSSMLRHAAQDPRQEIDLAVLQQLQEKRDALALRYGRAGLAFLLTGGEVRLIAPRKASCAATAAVPTLHEAPTAPVAAAPPQPDASVAAPPDTSAEATEATEAVPASAPSGTSEPAQPSAPPADPAALARLAEGGMNPIWSRAEQTTPVEPPLPEGPDALGADLFETLGPLPDRIDTVEDALAELSGLQQAVQRLDPWPYAPKPAQRAMVGHIVARARRVQDHAARVGLTDTDSAELDRIFGIMSAYSKREQPGFVYGLMRSHTPSQGTWADDARWWADALDSTMPGGVPLNPERALDHLQERLDDRSTPRDELLDAVGNVLEAGVSPDDPRLVRATASRMADLKTQARFKRLRKAIRESQRASADDDASYEAEVASGTQEPPEDWPLRERVAGARAVLIGGDLREEARQRIQAAFGFDSLDWVTTDHTRSYASVANRITSGGCDLVILLRRFIGHDVDRIIIPACRSSGVPWVSVDRGYGVSQIRTAMDRFLASSDAAR